MATVIILVVVGALLLFLETLLPGLILGIIGLTCLGAAVVIAYSSLGFAWGNGVLISVLVGLLIGIALWLKYFPGSRVAAAFTSKKRIGDIGTDRPHLLNKTGTALTDLRPGGMAQIDEKRVDVITEGGMINRGTTVRVVAVEGMRIVVRAVE